MTRRSLSALAAVLAFSLSAPAGAAQAPPFPAVGGFATWGPLFDGAAAVRRSQVFSDGSRSVEALAADALPGLTPPAGTKAVLLRYESGAVAAALVDETAVLALETRSEAEARQMLQSMGLEPLRALMPDRGLWLVRSRAPEDGLELSARLARSRPAFVRHAVPNLRLAHKLASTWSPNDPMLDGQWYLSRLAIREAWGLSRGDPGVGVVVVDTGCDVLHPELGPKLDMGRDVIRKTDDPSYLPNTEGNSHGTACAGLVGAVTDNATGISGTCPDCRLRCVRLLGGPTEVVPLDADVDAFNFALNSGAAVVSNSWGYYDPNQAVPMPLVEAIENVFSAGRGGKGTLVLFAAGNENTQLSDAVGFLAITGVVGVGAIDNYDRATQYTNYGPGVDLVAPTGTVTTDIRGADGDTSGDYTDRFGGTSSACPVAAGVAGLLAAMAPDWTAAQLHDVMLRTTRPAPLAIPDADGHDPHYGYGIIDPVKALSEIQKARPELWPPDAGAPQPDAAVEPPPEPPKGEEVEGGGGCGCSAAAGPAWGVALALAIAGALGAARRSV